MTENGGDPDESTEAGEAGKTSEPTEAGKTSEPTEAGKTSEPTEAGKTSEPGEPAEPAGKLTKSQKLEARAARLREAEQRRAERARAAAPTGGPAPVRRRWVIATSVLGVVAAALVALLVVGYFSWQHQRDLNSARASATKAAKSFAVDFGSYDYQHLDTEFAEVAKKMTTSFAKNYLETSDRLKPTFVQYKTQVTARVQDTGVTSVSTASAVVVVFLDQTVKTSQTSTARIDRNRLEVHLQKSNGHWLVSKLLAK